jgi:hypothetical protein
MSLDIEGVLSAHWPIPVFGCECTPVDEESGVKACLSEPWEAHVAAVLRAQIDGALAEAWDEAAELADSVIVSWMAVPGLHPTEPEPHPAAIAAAGARRTLVVLRSRMTEALRDRAAHLSDTERAES